MVGLKWWLYGGLTSANGWFLWGKRMKKRALMERIGISLLEMVIFHSKHGW